MPMTPARFREAMNLLSDEMLEDLIEALDRSRDSAMHYTVRARLPECGEFGAIAQDLDFVLSTFEGVVPNDDPRPSNTKADALRALGWNVTEVRLSKCDVVDLSGLPFPQK
jgi:hypothetical protein